MEWIKTGWGKDFSKQFDDRLNFHVSFENLVKCSDTFSVISTRVINRIQQKYPGPYYLMVSGGIDSQAMLWSWIQSGVPFIPISVEYVSNNQVFNSHDLIQLAEFADKNDIEVNHIEFDIIDFLENRLLDYAQKYQCTSPQICTHMCMSESITDGTIFYSGNFARHAIDRYTYTIFGLWRYATLSNRNIIPFFLLHDAEFDSALGINISEQKLTDHIPNDVNISNHRIYLNRAHSYINAGIPVIPQKTKYTGFEKIKDWYDLQSKRLTFADRMQFSNMPSKRIFDVLFRYRLQKYVKYQDIVVYK